MDFIVVIDLGFLDMCKNVLRCLHGIDIALLGNLWSAWKGCYDRLVSLHKEGDNGEKSQET